MAKLQTLYLRRYLLNGQELLDWAAANGGGGEPARAAGMHVTVTYSRRPMDWASFIPDPEPLAIAAARGRRVERFDGDVAALLFEAPVLVERHKVLLQLGASGDYLYRPHVTFAYGPGFRPPAGPAFAGELRFGPEVASPVPMRGGGL